MNDPFKVLGVSSSVNEEELKTAYLALIDSAEGDDASVNRINEAYDEAIRKMRGQPSYAKENASIDYADVKSDFPDIRSFISRGKIAEADEILDGIPERGRNAEWFFLKATVFYNRGYLENAVKYYTEAYQREPENQEYRDVYKVVTEELNGKMYGNPYESSVCNSTAGICQTMLILDCCCRCCFRGSF